MMQIEPQTRDHTVVMALRGEFTADDADRFRREAIQRMDQDGRDFVIDLAEAPFVDSKALETMLWLQGEAAERLGQVRLANPGDNIRTILDMTRLTARLEAHDSVEAAIASLA